MFLRMKGVGCIVVSFSKLGGGDAAAACTHVKHLLCLTQVIVTPTTLRDGFCSGHGNVLTRIPIVIGCNGFIFE